MPSIRFWCGQPGGTAEYRCYGPGRALARAGWDVVFDDEGVDVSADGRVLGDPDVLVMCRVMGDYVPDAVRRIRRKGRTRIVFDVDDWFGGVPDYNPASQLPAALVATMHQAMTEADVVTVSTPQLAELYAPLNRTVVLPNFLDPGIWAPFDGYRAERDFLTVGWAGGFHWRGGDLELLKPWITDFLDSHTDVRFAAIGCGELLDWLGIDGVTTPRLPPGPNTHERNRDLHPYGHLPAMLANLDVGLVPLRYNLFNQAKSWCKGLEYGAMSVPVVASQSREYRAYIRPGVNGLFARPSTWGRQIDTILDDLDAYRRGARKVAAEYMIDDHIHRWVDAYAR